MTAQLTPGGATSRTPPLPPGGTTRRGDAHPANTAWETLMLAHVTVIRQFSADEDWEGLSIREYDVLYTLSKCPGPIRLSELNRHVLLSQPALSRMVDRLADRGLIDRVPDPKGDRRGVGLALTEDGRAVQRRIGRRHARTVARSMLSRLTPAELRQLEELCGRLAGTTLRSE